MLKLKELRLSGIGRFVDKQTIDFSHLGSIVQVDGLNLNTGGSSGSGKTTVFNAHDYLLGLNDLPNTVLQSRLTKEGIAVEALYDWDGKEVEISRSKSKGLSIRVDQDVFSGSSKLSEEKLDEILGIPRHLLRPMVHKRQKEGGFFLQLTPKQIHEFLTDCLGLSDLRKKAEIIDKKIKELTEKKAQAQSVLESAQSGLGASRSALAALGEAPIKEIGQETVLALKAKADASSAALQTILAKHKVEDETLDLNRPSLHSATFDKTAMLQAESKSNELRKKIGELDSAEHSRVAGVKARISELSLKKSELTQVIKDAANVKNEAVKLALEVKKIRQSICPTCEQSWITENAKSKETELLAKIERFKELIALGAQAENDLILVTQEINDLTPQATFQVPESNKEVNREISELLKVIASERAKEQEFNQSQHIVNGKLLEEFSRQQKELKERQTAEANQARGQLDIDRRILDSAVQKMKAYEEAKSRYENTAKTLKAQIDNFSQKVTENETYWRELDNELTLAEEVKKAIKSYASCSFDDALVYVGDVATRIIRHIPTMANSTIQLESLKETKEGKVKEEVNAVISMDGEIDIPIKSLSGGERSSVDLAVDLAVVDLLENKTNKGIDTFILDEPFTGLDTIGIEMALEVLKNSNINKRLVIVDHNPEVKQMVENRLLVERDGQTSRIIQS